MLANLRSWFAFHVSAAFISLRSLGQKPIATIMTVMVIAITLVLPALFWVATDNLTQLTKNWQHGGNISLYLKTKLTKTEQEKILLEVRKVRGVSAATFKSPEEGLLELKQQEGMEDVLKYLPDNPLPAVIDVVPTIDVNSKEKLQKLYVELKSYPQVEQAKLDIQWVSRLQAILQFVTTLAHSFIILLALVVILIIGNSLRAAVHSRKEEIQVLKLIGAKDSYIVRPFLYAGIWYGLIGAILAVLLLNIFLLSLTIVVSQVAASYQMHYELLGLSLRQISWLLILAIILGWLGARVSVKRQLAIIEP